MSAEVEASDIGATDIGAMVAGASDAGASAVVAANHTATIDMPFPSENSEVEKLVEMQFGLSPTSCSQGVIRTVLRTRRTVIKPLAVAVQCIALPYNDEITLRVMKELETGLKKIT